MGSFLGHLLLAQWSKVTEVISVEKRKQGALRYHLASSTDGHFRSVRISMRTAGQSVGLETGVSASWSALQCQTKYNVG